MAARRTRHPVRAGVSPWTLGLVGVGAAGAVLLLARRASASSTLPAQQRFDRAPLALPEPPTTPALPSAAEYSDADVEAAARMLASENPKASLAVKAEQLLIQVRAAKRDRQTLAERITGGKGYGPQGGPRPVATTQPATEDLRQQAILILSGAVPAKFPEAKSFFEPEQQDRAFAIAERARAKQAKGEKLTQQEARLLIYKSDAADIRRRWAARGERYLGTVDEIEFWT